MLSWVFSKWIPHGYDLFEIVITSYSIHYTKLYERGTSGKSGSADLVHESITLEYELNRNLFFRLLNGNPKDSGIDVVLKFGPK